MVYLASGQADCQGPWTSCSHYIQTKYKLSPGLFLHVKGMFVHIYINMIKPKASSMQLQILSLVTANMIMFGLKYFLLLLSCKFVLTDISLETKENTLFNGGYNNSDLKMWWSYAEEVMAQALEHIGRQDNCSGLAYSISLLRDMLDPHSFCPRTFYDATKNILAGQLKSKCGQLMLRLNDRGNNKDLEPVYRIGIPQWFHLNVSFLAFNSHAGMDYPICDTSDMWDLIGQNSRYVESHINSQS